MGLSISNLLRHFLGKEDIRILMVGLDAAGKTTILYQLKVGEVTTTIPTIGFNVETVEYKNIRFTVWDVGGQKRIRNMWRYYFTNTAAIIYVVDSSDIERLSEAAEELHGILENQDLQQSVLLVFANKQDLPNAASVADITEHLRLRQLNHTWHIHATCATRGTGLYEGLEYLRDMLNQRKTI